MGVSSRTNTPSTVVFDEYFQMLMEPGIILDKYIQIQLVQEMLVAFMETILEYILDIISQETDNNNNNTNGGFQPPPPPPHQHGNGGTYSRVSCMIDPSGRQQHPSSSSISSTPSPASSSSTAIVNRPSGRVIGEEGVTAAKLDLSRSYVIGTMGGQQQQQQHYHQHTSQHPLNPQQQPPTIEGASLPRNILYEQYKDHCKELGFTQVNAASFGKLIRQVFNQKLSTRRLGTRGNSKYHYNGICLKQNSPLRATMGAEELERMMNGSQQPHKNSQQGGLRLPEIELPILDECILLRYGLSVGHVLKFFDEYREHSRKILNCVKDFRLKLIEQLWISFWQKNNVYDADIEQCQQRGINEENSVELGLMRGAPILDNRSLCRLCSLPEIISYVETFDLKFYQIILDFFFSSPLRIPLESDLCNNLRNFGKSIEFWMENALGGGNNSNLNYLIPPAFKKAKLECIRLLANSLTRLSSFVHLAITARSVLQNKEQVKKVHDDFNRVDFGVFHWQADWLCSSNSSLNKNSFQESTELNESFCNCNVLARELVGQFRERLSRHCSIEEWADWLESIVDKALNFPKTFKYSPQQIAIKGKRFLLAWTLHSSLLLKEITLHSSTSFGEFHLVRLVFDDYLLIIMERKLAQILGKLPIELMAPEVEKLPLPGPEPPLDMLNVNVEEQRRGEEILGLDTEMEEIDEDNYEKEENEEGFVIIKKQRKIQEIKQNNDFNNNDNILMKK
uniref:RFX-type winged-helix domain-containing protein n=1 Tax=Meloidogyne javanica TaxID=6303 RepID=A0A915MLF7_MELJA